MDGAAGTEELYSVAVGGCRLRVSAIGRPRRGMPCLVFLHEGLGSIGQWRDFPQRAAALIGLPCIVYDRRGHGGSDPVELPRPANFLEMEGAEVLPALLQALGIDKPILVGHSDGGTAALYFAAAFPERPLAVVTLAAHVFLEAKTREALRDVTKRWQRDPEFRRRLLRHHGTKGETMFRGWAETWQSPELAEWSMADRLAAIRCPLLAIQGAEDAHGSAQQLEVLRTRTGGPVETCLLPATGHAPHLEAAEEVLSRVCEFVKRAIAKRDSGE